MTFEKGDFILIDYVGRIKETNEVFDTTIEEVAKEHGIYREGAIYEPKLVAVGEGWILKALEEKLLEFEVGEERVVEIPPEKAYGHRDPSKIRLIPLKRLLEKGITPRIGMRVEYNGRIAIVRTVGSGRVQLDFNHPLAGKTLVYKVKVVKKLEEREEKILALIHRRIPIVEVEKFKIEIEDGNLTVVVPEEAFYIDGIQVAKRGIANDIMKFFQEINSVCFIERFERKTSEQQP